MIKDLILKSQFVGFINTWGLTFTNDKEEAAVFEKFVTYAYLSHDDPSAFIGNVDLLDFCCTGGGDDAKLDGIGIKVNGKLVSSQEDIDQIVSCSKKVDVEFFLIQAKERTDFDSAAFNTFGIGAQNFFTESKLPENDRIKQFRELKDYIYTEASVIRKLDNNPSVSIVYAFCGKVPDDQHTEAIKKIVVENLNQCPDSLNCIKVEILGANDLVRLCKEIENDYEVSMNISDIFPLTTGGKKSIKKAYSFTCTATELIRLLSREDGSLRRSLFNDNVRDYLGNKGPVNSEIEETIKKEPELFLMCNNGITIVCSDFLQVRDKLVTIQNPQIVNGCQTCNSIFSQRSNPSINNVHVLVKLVCTEEIEITNKIVRGTNKQNQVLEESFEATKPFHQNLEDYFLAKKEVASLYYERRNKQYSSCVSINKYQIVNLRVITQTSVAMFLHCPHVAHRHEAKLLETYACENRILYKEGQSYAPYFTAALMWYRVEEAFRNKILPSSLKPYKAHIYYIMTFMTGKYPLTLEVRNDAMEVFCCKLENILIGKDCLTIIRNAGLLFKMSFNEWIGLGHNRYAVKEKKEFVDFLTDKARVKYVDKSAKKDKIDDKDSINAAPRRRGRILSIRIKNGSWFAFIKVNDNEENVYFDNFTYNGEFKDIIEGQFVSFKEAKRNVRGAEMLYALDVRVEKL